MRKKCNCQNNNSGNMYRCFMYFCLGECMLLCSSFAFNREQNYTMFFLSKLRFGGWLWLHYKKQFNL
jgi:hypothetical protein